METITQNILSKGKLLIKGVIIGILVLVLQIPVLFVMDLIKEREERQKEAIAEVSSKWAGKQTVTGPILVLPYLKLTPEGKTQKHFASFLPEDLQVNASIRPEEKYRGIYKVMLYSSVININTAFAPLNLGKLGIDSADVLWNEARVKLHLSDVKGLNEELKVQINGKSLALSPSSEGNGSIDDGLVASFPMTAAMAASSIPFQTTISLNGSEQLLFTPTGRLSTVKISSAWPHPSFTGSILPQSSEVRDSGFTATWKSLGHKRAFPQQWSDEAFTTYFDAKSNPVPGSNVLQAAAFGADLFVPVNGYQKTLRSIKYSILCVLLTFAAFFLIETSNNRSIHPFHYGLVGVALVLFYTLLLSFSEYIGFNAAYAVASALTVALIAWFVSSLLQSGRLTMILSSVLMLLYLYVFTILQLHDYSLLFGSLGLFLTLAVIMHFSKKVKW